LTGPSGIKVDSALCTACGACVTACPFSAVEITKDIAVFNDKCNLCGACEKACPVSAISIEKAASAPVAEGYHGVWVFAEQDRGKLKSSAFELLARGKELAGKLGVPLSAVCLGEKVEDISSLIAHGADRIYIVDDPALAKCQDEPYAAALAGLVREHKPEILLGPASSFGRSFIPKVAAMLETGLTADCTGLDIDPQSHLLLQTRPTFGGNVMATITCESRRPQMATVRPHVFKKSAPDSSRKGEVIRVDLKKEVVSSRTRLVSFIEDVTEKVKLDECSVIVSGGRGLGKPENFKVIRELADALGAAVGSSRPPVDDGWIPYSHQVGQTGKTVCPKIYFAVGISGAVQHLAGMQTAETIVAINEDPTAPIFEVATYGIVGDLFKIVPLLTERLKKS
jgi:electron transfer flavoprotein alpha subunit